MSSDLVEVNLNDLEANVFEENSNRNECRYCKSSDETLIRPCLCKDPIHRQCLIKWENTRADRLRGQCEVCKYKYATNSTLSCEKWCGCFKLYIKGIFHFLLIGISCIAIIGVKYGSQLEEEEKNVHDGIFCVFGIIYICLYVMGWLLLLADRYDGDQSHLTRETRHISCSSINELGFILNVIISAIGSIAYYFIFDQFIISLFSFGLGVIIVSVIPSIYFSITCCVLCFVCVYRNCLRCAQDKEYNDLVVNV